MDWFSTKLLYLVLILLFNYVWFSMILSYLVSNLVTILVLMLATTPSSFFQFLSLWSALASEISNLVFDSLTAFSHVVMVVEIPFYIKEKASSIT